VRPVLVGVCDTDPERLAWFERIDTAARLTVDHRELLAADEIDVVYIAVPHHMHERLYLDAAAAGKDFLAEKPFGIDLAAAERIVAAIERAGVFVRSRGHAHERLARCARPRLLATLADTYGTWPCPRQRDDEAEGVELGLVLVGATHRRAAHLVRRLHIRLQGIEVADRGVGVILVGLQCFHHGRAR
jgi:hypothetical protein